jgi:predicted metal-binding protein
MPSLTGLVHPVAPVRDLARDLGVSCAQVLRIASALGLRVSCPSSVITIEQAEQIQSAYLRTDLLSRVAAPR